jgi:MarR family transcriptional regulator, organic hydroperoxide resistance regulator
MDSMINQQLQDELSLLMIRSSLKGKYGMMEVADKHDITLMQALTVCLLDPKEGVPMSSLSNFLSCDPSNVTGIVDRLVSGKFIERKECEQDRRIKRITLTQKGIELRQTLLHIAAEKRLPNLAGLTDKEVTELIRLFDKATNIPSGSIAAQK